MIQTRRVCRVRPLPFLSRSKFSLFTLFLFIFCGLVAPIASAEDLQVPVPEARSAPAPVPSAISCNISIQVIGASQQQKLSAPAIEMNSLPSEVHEQLAPLPFSHYHQIDSQEYTLPLKERHEFTLAGLNKEKHQLVLRVLDTMRDKIRVSVKWQGPGGGNLVQARMVVTNGEHLVLGADESKENSTILTVKISCS